MTSSPSPTPQPTPDDDGLVPASFGAKAVLTAAPFLLAALVYLALRWLL